MRSDHLRAGLPVLAQADRPARPAALPAPSLARRPAAVARRPRLAARWVGADAGTALHLPRLLADPRHLPRHHGPAPRGGALLHQPRRPRRASDDGRRCWRCSAPSTCCPPMYGALGRLYAPDLVASRPHRLGGARAAAAGCSAGSGGDLLTALLGAGAFAAFLSTSSGLIVVGRRRAQPGRAGPRLERHHRPSASPASLAVAATAPAHAALLGTRGRARGRAGLRGGGRRRSARCWCSGIWWRGLTDVGRGRRAARRRRPLRRRPCSTVMLGDSPGGLARRGGRAAGPGQRARRLRHA